MKTLVAFDLDDTLYKEMDYVASGYRTVAKALADATGADARELFALISANRPLGFEAALEALAGTSGVENFTVDSMVEIYRAHKPDIALFPGVAATLADLKERGAALALITDGSTRHQRAKINALGLDRFFAPDAILISEETGGDKRTDVPWEIAEKRFGAQRNIYVGDNLSKDFRLPNRRGWTTVMMRDTDGRNVFPQIINQWSLDYRPKIVLDSPAPLCSLL